MAKWDCLDPRALVASKVYLDQGAYLAQKVREDGWVLWVHRDPVANLACKEFRALKEQKVFLGEKELGVRLDQRVHLG